jgi:hypothetical protein
MVTSATECKHRASTIPGNNTHISLCVTILLTHWTTSIIELSSPALWSATSITKRSFYADTPENTYCPLHWWIRTASCQAARSQFSSSTAPTNCLAIGPPSFPRSNKQASKFAGPGCPPVAILVLRKQASHTMPSPSAMQRLSLCQWATASL